MRILLLLTVIAAIGCGQLPTAVDVSTLISSPRENQPTPGDQREHTSTTHGVRLFDAARRLERNGDLRQAIEQYTRLTSEFPEHADAFHRLAVVHDKLGEPDAAARLYRRALELAPQSPSLLCDYGYSRYLSGDLELAERTLRRAVELDQNLARAHSNLALVLVRQGRHSEAVAAFEDAGLTTPDAEKNLHQAQTAAHLSAVASHPQFAGQVGQ